MKKIVTLRQALTDSAYFGGQLSGDSWAHWWVLLLAILGEPLDEVERLAFAELTGRPTAPTEPVREFAGVHRAPRWQEPCPGRPSCLPGQLH